MNIMCIILHGDMIVIPNIYAFEFLRVTCKNVFQSVAQYRHISSRDQEENGNVF